MPRGMTRLEVSVALVMASIAVTVVSIVFKSVERSAGNARAMSRILAFRKVVEETASRTFSYPTLEQARGTWASQASDSLLISPWGGRVGSELDDASRSRGVAGVGFLDITRREGAIPGRAGGIGYMVGRSSGQTATLHDLTNNADVKVGDYGCFMYDPAGTYPHFPAGGPPR